MQLRKESLKKSGFTFISSFRSSNIRVSYIHNFKLFFLEIFVLDGPGITGEGGG